jgi:hypothetical protein
VVESGKLLIALRSSAGSPEVEIVDSANMGQLRVAQLVVPENSIRLDSRGEAESAHHRA